MARSMRFIFACMSKSIFLYIRIRVGLWFVSVIFNLSPAYVFAAISQRISFEKVASLLVVRIGR